MHSTRFATVLSANSPPPCERPRRLSHFGYCFASVDLMSLASPNRCISPANDNSEQLLLYADLAGRVLDGRKIRLQYAVVSKTKQPVLEIHKVEFDPERLKRTKAVFREVWNAISTGAIYPAPSQMNCYSCGYKTACREWQG